MYKVLSGALLAALSLSASSAFARADLEVTISGPGPIFVYDSGRYEVEVANIGNRNANTVWLKINLPATNTSPTVHLMGTLDGYDTRCFTDGPLLLACDLGRIRKGRSTTVWLDLTLPQSSAPIEIDASASTSSRENSLANNYDTFTAALTNYATTITGPHEVINRHCTGQGLTSFWECLVSPSSISSHGIILEANNTVTIVGNPYYTGDWNQPAADRLQFNYYRNGQLAASFDGYGVGGDCFEGVTTFPSSPNYVSLYEVCPR